MTSPHWDKNLLYNFVRENMGDRLLLAVSNREPYVHSQTEDGAPEWSRPVGGLTEAIDPVMRASGGTWVALGSGEADRSSADKRGRIKVPPDNPEYTLRRVWLSERDYKAYYLGFSNQTLWPLSHITFTSPVFRESHWKAYQKANRVFAEAVLEEAGKRKAAVLVQDYHLALLPRYLRNANAALNIGLFWHIPWPPYEVFRTCPWRKELLEGLLGNDLLGFHTSGFCQNFIEAAERLLNVKVNHKQSTITYQGRETRVLAFPISMDYDAISASADSVEVEQEMAALRQEFRLEGKVVGIGMDRVDYTKGIPERLEALDRFFEDNPSWRGKVVFIQAGIPSRTQIDKYQELTTRIETVSKRLNAKYGGDSWQPVVFPREQLSSAALNAMRRLGDFCIVSSLHDGMNLVAKEYVSARNDEDGVLILSEFTGAADELKEALIINPFDINGFAAKIKEALEMPKSERKKRMRKMRRTVSENNIYRWGGEILTSLLSSHNQQAGQ